MQTQLRIAGAARETGALLREYLTQRGLIIGAAGPTICYGASTSRAPALNMHCGSDKIERLRLFARARVSVPPWFEGDKMPRGLQFPLLGRSRTGFGGTDIMLVLQEEDLQWRIRAGADYFVQYIPVAREQRIWIFGDTALDTYEKVMRRPAEYKYVGRNFRNGFEFERQNRGTPEAETLATQAVRAVSLDFAAVDLIQSKDGRWYVLETNTAPGVIRSGAQATLQKLAERMVEWRRGNKCQ